MAVTKKRLEHAILSSWHGKSSLRRRRPADLWGSDAWRDGFSRRNEIGAAPQLFSSIINDDNLASALRAYVQILTTRRQLTRKSTLCWLGVGLELVLGNEKSCPKEKLFEMRHVLTYHLQDGAAPLPALLHAKASIEKAVAAYHQLAIKPPSLRRFWHVPISSSWRQCCNNSGIHSHAAPILFVYFFEIQRRHGWRQLEAEIATGRARVVVAELIGTRHHIVD